MCLDSQVNPQDKAIQKIEMVSCDIDIISAIMNRRSIRKFTSEAVDDKILNTIINAGLSAPTAKNKKPCHFIIAKDKESLLKLSQNNANAGMLSEAACGIIVCGDSSLEEINNRGVSFACENGAVCRYHIRICG